MQPGEVVFQEKIKTFNLVIRYPTMDDIASLQEFINAASAEHTYIRLQGETFTFEEEAQYVDDVLSKMKAKTMTKLLALQSDELVAVADITLQPYSTKHLGTFGIIVKKTARGMGIGKKLMSVLISTAKIALPDLEIVVLSVYEGNAAARKLYESMGFMEYGRLPNGRKTLTGYEAQIDMYLPLDSM